MARTKTTVRLGRPIFVAAPGQRIGNKIILNRRNSMLKIKNSSTKNTSNWGQKNGQVVRRFIR